MNHFEKLNKANIRIFLRKILVFRVLWLYFGVKTWREIQCTSCLQGRRQSPIDLDPAFLNYDCKLENMSVDKQSVSARITNTGQSLVLRVEDGQLAINITGGPLAYKYQFQVIL